MSTWAKFGAASLLVATPILGFAAIMKIAGLVDMDVAAPYQSAFDLSIADFVFAVGLAALTFVVLDNLHASRHWAESRPLLGAVRVTSFLAVFTAPVQMLFWTMTFFKSAPAWLPAAVSAFPRIELAALATYVASVGVVYAIAYARRLHSPQTKGWLSGSYVIVSDGRHAA